MIVAALSQSDRAIAEQLEHAISVYRATVAEHLPNVLGASAWADHAYRALTAPDHGKHRSALGMIYSEFRLLCYSIGPQLGIGLHPSRLKSGRKAAELLGVSYDKFKSTQAMDTGWPGPYGGGAR